ncbi:MAG: hypothetical protein IAF02_20300 [Anaerolineae bacterium]|nr:hypothetical protein [Anaerolineae bacterium]
MFSSHEIKKHNAIESFRYSRWQARKEALLSKVWGKVPCLKSFGDISGQITPQRRSLGVREIPVEKITGTVGRQDDFDGRFRPLKNHLRERWVNIAVNFQDAGWPPIDVFKVGEEYFVLDGHHRTSYARQVGMAFMEANVWEMVQEPASSQVRDVPPPIKYAPKPIPVSTAVVPDSLCCCCG